MRKIIIILGILVVAVIVWYAIMFNRGVRPDPIKPPDVVKLTSPQPNSIVTSPLTVTGEARGFWYFEASFPVRVLDANGNELGVVPAQAQGEWMTTDFVPFEGTIEFKASPTPTGFLVLQKDNPSGLPEHDRQITYPIRFR